MLLQRQCHGLHIAIKCYEKHFQDFEKAELSAKPSMLLYVRALFPVLHEISIKELNTTML